MSRERAQSAVEFALVAPIFFALIFGVTAAGWLFFQSSAVNDAAQGAAREAIVVSYSGQRLSLSGGCATGTPVPVEQAAQHAANILPVDPNPLCRAANNSFCPSGSTLLTQVPVGQDATIELCVVGGVSSPSAYRVQVRYVAHPLEPLLGTSLHLTSTSTLAAGAA